jgi:hypothetical protein
MHYSAITNASQGERLEMQKRMVSVGSRQHIDGSKPLESTLCFLMGYGLLI